MKKLVEYPLEGGGSVLVEVDPAQGGDRLASTSKPNETFEQAASRIRPVATIILEQVKDLAPEALTVEFGVKFGAKAGVILASADSEAHCKITLSWKPGARSG